DITAKAEGDFAPTGPGQAGTIQFMMRSLLKDRFGLAYHVETKEAPVYNLVLARADGKLGPKLEKATTDCQALLAARPGGGAGGARGAGGPWRAGWARRSWWAGWARRARWSRWSRSWWPAAIRRLQPESSVRLP